MHTLSTAEKMVEIENALRTRKIPTGLAEKAAELRFKFSGVSQIGTPKNPDEITFQSVDDSIDALHTEVIATLRGTAE